MEGRAVGGVELLRARASRGAAAAASVGAANAQVEAGLAAAVRGATRGGVWRRPARQLRFMKRQPLAHLGQRIARVDEREGAVDVGALAAAGARGREERSESSQARSVRNASAQPPGPTPD